ncbi:prostaglandin E2 receptor EP4 subtype-like [Ostrea edulis]|uniref:prostaglandin E2 receptor EP4 subtype-like n=1 Tax=Ostrea edulis TaxID=37623 RepID=UPI002095622A|nr:prostaglandin E2 receptor EP4 subtype-like [Ostrea edulis]
MSYNTSDQLILQESIVATTVPVYLIFSFGFIGNGLAFYVLISSSKNHKWVPFQRLVLGLLTTDTGALLLMFPVILVRFVSDFTYVFPTSLCNFSSFTLMFTMTSSALIVCMMSLDRFVAVVFPFTYKVQNKRSRANITLLSVWIFSAMFSCTHLLGFGSNFNFYPGTWCFLNYMGKSALDRASSFVFAVFGIIVVLVTVVTNCVVIVSLCRSQSSPQKRNHSFTIVFLMVLVLLFLLCTAPIMITVLSFAAQWTTNKDPKDNTTMALSVINAIFDPWIYILLRKEVLVRVRNKAIKLCSWLPFCHQNKLELQESSGSTSGGESQNTADTAQTVV